MKKIITWLYSSLIQESEQKYEVTKIKNGYLFGGCYYENLDDCLREQNKYIKRFFKSE